MSEFRVLADRFEQMLAAENISKYSFCLTESEKQELNVENGSFKLQYRLMINGEPRPVSLRIARFREGEAEKLVAGVRAWRVRR